MSDPKRLGPEPSNGRSLDKAYRIGPGATDRRGPDRFPRGRHPEESMRPEKLPSGLRRAREPLLERRPDEGKLGRATRDRDHGKVERPGDFVKVEHVEPADHRPVDEHRSRPVERSERPDQGHDPPGSVGAVDGDTTDPGGLEVLGQGEQHRGRRGEGLPPLEGAVVDAHDLRVRFTERAPQR